MEDLLELLFHLIGKFWPLILAYFAYKAVDTGKGKAKRAPRRMPPVLTPAHGGGIPKPQAGRSMSATPKSDRHVDNAPFPVAETLEMRESLPMESEINDISAQQPSIPATQAASNRAEQNNRFHEEREGMKWALIYAPPRAKMPFAPPGRPRQ